MVAKKDAARGKLPFWVHGMDSRSRGDLHPVYDLTSRCRSASPSCEVTD